MVKKYYIISPAVGTSQTGSAYPAAESYDNYDFNAPNSVHKLTFREFPKFIPDIRFKLAKRAKLTAMLSQAAISANGFLINGKLKSTLERFNIVPHRFYKATIEDLKGGSHDYFWMHLVWEDQSIIDWSSTRWFYMHREEKVILDIKSVTDYQNKRKELGMFTPIQMDNVHFKPSSLNMILHPIHAHILVDDALKNELLEGTYTGIQFSNI